MDREEYDWLERILAQPIAERAAAPAGFRNRTELITLTDGARVVLQRYRSRVDAERRVRVMLALLDPAALRGIAIPRVRHFDLDADPAWIVFDALPGVPVSVSDEMDSSSVESARMMGELLARFRRLRPAGLGIDDLWADPRRLVARAKNWVTQLDPALTDAERAALDRLLHTVPDLFANRKIRLAHGDFAPDNMLTDGAALTGLLDFESVRLADRLLDPAWWAWSVGLAGPRIDDPAWPEFLVSAGIDPAEPELPQRVHALQVLRVLELLTARADLDPAVLDSTRKRLSRSLTG
ncbi:phosphotransferase enzyme family protein [Nocardia arthritidis]|uniref:Phosphotransferase n=1 Tax=Nocardia arthritidis TaxID=228602 RepID=A0A6G9Y925_9NOCA|nr:aminoglycoside phosphotransferase family protein [Nocardia arthritidis]QIS09556.1 phosphotransferase [Nocardia arthritidis]